MDKSEIKTFNTLLSVKVSLILLYLALTLPIPYITISNLRYTSLILILVGLFIIINISNETVKTNEEEVSLSTNLLSCLLGKKNWIINWKDIKDIKSYPTSQGSKVHYFITNKDANYLIPQRLNNQKDFARVITNNTGINTKNLTYISPLWTYNLLTIICFLMILAEVTGLSFRDYLH